MVPLLHTLCIDVLASCLRSYPPSSLNVALDSNNWNLLLPKVVTQHARDRRYENKERTLVPSVLTLEYMKQLEEECEALSEDHYEQLDDLWWRLLVEQDFPRSKFDRPELFNELFTELEARVKAKSDELHGLVTSKPPHAPDLPKKILAILGSFQKVRVCHHPPPQPEVALLTSTKTRLVGRVAPRLRHPPVFDLRRQSPNEAPPQEREAQANPARRRPRHVPPRVLEGRSLEGARLGRRAGLFAPSLRRRGERRGAARSGDYF